MKSLNTAPSAQLEQDRAKWRTLLPSIEALKKFVSFYIKRKGKDGYAQHKIPRSLIGVPDFASKEKAKDGVDIASSRGV